MEKTAYISEIFSSIQGEGLYIGERQLFIRFCGCNLKCDFCDTDYQKRDFVKIFDENENIVEEKNPVSVEKLWQITQKFLKNPHHSIKAIPKYAYPNCPTINVPLVLIYKVYRGVPTTLTRY